MKTKQQKIQNLDLDPIRIKLTFPVKRGGYAWPNDEAKKAIEEYRNFLMKIAAKKSVEEKVSPRPVVDIVWHTHILFTKKYHKDCQDIFGYYIHHEPNINPDQ